MARHDIGGLPFISGRVGRINAEQVLEQLSGRFEFLGGKIRRSHVRSGTCGRTVHYFLNPVDLDPPR